jgi:hypothetical protein
MTFGRTAIAAITKDCHASACYDDGISRLSEAIEAFDKAGISELHLAHFHRGCCHFGLGNLAEAIAEARWTFASVPRLGDSRTIAPPKCRPPRQPPL